ncbi:unnamed protein product [Macrosiphum euphorbiae]|uniref:Uncharacterized protein n=1 Tax=Macrosiphum euphorbiae TaxID=13131 RepID=A0AAV0X635_9HEMI|nr:unnamed protein product [Macrosiphum euphorbiae]
MSCVRESSPQSEHVVQRPEPKTRRFNPLRRLRRIFRRKAQSPEPNDVKSCDNIVEPPSLDTSRSRSTSQLIDEPFTRRRSLHSTILSVSHDSVFNPEQHSGQSDSESTVSVPRLGFPQANIQAELLEAVRRRRKIQDDDDSFDMDNEDLGLPRSPSMHSPTIATGNDLRLSKELITKSSHSTCSDGSLLSMGSSEMDEDSFGAHNSRHSSKISLHDKRTSQTHLDSSDGDYSTSVPLSHDVAKHRMAIRPKRKHGNPRSKKPLSVTNALPATPEVNEEHSGRSTSPETKPQTADTADGTTTISTVTSDTKTTTSTTNTNTSTTTTTSINSNDTVITTAVPVVVTDTVCTATASTVESCDLDTSVDEISVENVPRREEGFFHRLLSRRSTKKKAAATAKSASTEDVDVDRFLFDETTGARPRQREEPPPAGRMQLSYPPDMPPDHGPQHHRVPVPSVATAEDVFEPDTFAPIKQSFSLGQHHSNQTAATDDDATSSGDGSSVQKSSSSDSMSSAALDESVDSAVAVSMTTDGRHRSYSSSDSEHQVCGTDGGQQHLRPVPAPRPSKLYNGGGGTAADVVVRRKKRDDQQQPELLKVFARRSLKLGKDGEPEFLLVSADVDRGDDGDVDHKVMTANGDWPVEQPVAVASEDRVVVVVVDNDNHHAEHVVVDVNENRTVAAAAVEVVPRFKRIQQRREEWEKRLLQQQRN